MLVVAKEGFPDVLYSDIGADGSQADVIRIQAGGSRMPASAATVAASQHTMELKGREVFKSAVRQIAECVRCAAERLAIAPSEFGLVIPHQANAADHPSSGLCSLRLRGSAW